MTYAAAFNKSLNRPSNRQPEPAAQNLNDHQFLDETQRAPQDPVFAGPAGPASSDSFASVSAPAPVAQSNTGSQLSFPQTPVSATSELFPSSTPPNQQQQQQQPFGTPREASLSPHLSPLRANSSKRQSRNVSVPTSFLRHRSDSRVSYIDSNVAPSPFYSPVHSTSSSNRNSTIEPKDAIPLSADPAHKRRSFTVLADETGPHTFQKERKVDRLLDIPKSTPRELVPILTLFNSQQARVYKEGYFQLIVEKVQGTPTAGSTSTVGGLVSNSTPQSCYGSLSGNELAIWDINQRDFKPIYINVADASFTNFFNDKTIKIINPSSNRYYLKFETLEHQKAWFAALILSYFEFNSLHEAYTGALLSAKAVNLTDIKTLLAETRYSVAEWCNIKLNYISTKWLRVYTVVVPTQKDKPGYVNIYSSEKTSNKKNLIMTINQGFSCFSVYPQVPEVIDNASEIKVEGEITIHNWKFLLSKGVSNNTSMIPPASHNNSSSDNNSRSGNRSRSSSLSSMRLGKKRSSLSLASSNSGSVTNATTSSFDSTVLNSNNTGGLSNAPTQNNFVSSLYIIPESHPGVANFEIMIRFLIPLFDAFELYGRPKRLKSDKTNLNSLLFALPVLPKSKYLDYDEAFELINSKISGAPVPREAPKLSNLNKKTVTTTKTSGGKTTTKKKSKGILSVFKKFKEEPEEPVNDSSKANSNSSGIDSQTVGEFTTSIPIESWTNREWLFFLKYELRYKLALGYDGAGHLIQDFEALT